MEFARLDNQVRDWEFYNAGKGMNRGPILENGRYEWVALRGGRRGYWSDYHHSIYRRSLLLTSCVDAKERPLQRCVFPRILGLSTL